MIVRFAEHGPVDVVDEDCEYRPCFRFGFDKGPYTPGVGYTRPDTPWRPVCLARHLHGCPHRDDVYDHKCEDCGAVLAQKQPRDYEPSPCARCGGTKAYLLAVLLDPEPCCDSPSVAHRPQAYRQRCRSCGTWLRGTRLRMAREAAADSSKMLRE